MFSFFPNLYPEEILHSGVGRFHYYSFSQSYVKSIQDCFGESKQTCTVEIPNGLDYFSKRFGFYDSDYFIANHTLFPLFSPFLASNQQQQCLALIKKYGKGLYAKLGFGKSITTKVGYAYCPICVEKDYQKFRDVFLHRVHQMPKVLVCPDHSCLLKEYFNNTNKFKERQLIKLEYEKLDLKPVYVDNEDLSSKLIKFAVTANYILQANLKFSLEEVNLLYNTALIKNRLVDEHGLNKEKLLERLFDFYGEEFLELMDSRILDAG